jgi:hypothetical protein|eukprot:CAMPEP_0174297310 /NCGR_PEP_ID=MMETSP0809-20121228/50644_1 /TAXON_ID=73025 ORGANISM="Eutreptiella gymnastica-like, Strain CCMP1594" /NCGR_SAMPLE_ID=MMETSP0809 /ASSEMBLY_ACC=CAM_ASM_000658 /LENGTH=96 /DNA_ID=CAMNT_0015401017 /DNA_START=85 /DNA_END=375 /DNA_ORIENTATION=+
MSPPQENPLGVEDESFTHEERLGASEEDHSQDDQNCQKDVGKPVPKIGKGRAQPDFMNAHFNSSYRGVNDADSDIFCVGVQKTEESVVLLNGKTVK